MLETFEKRSKVLLSLLQRLEEQYGLFPKFGVEVEFYLLDPNNQPVTSKTAEKIITAAEINFPTLQFSKEKGNGQHEFSTIPFTLDLINLNACFSFKSSLSKFSYHNVIESQDIIGNIKTEVGNYIMNFAKKDCIKLSKVSYEAKPLIDDYGSSIHVHLTLHHLHDADDNIFDYCSIENNTNCPNILIKIIASILFILNSSLYLIMNKEEDYKRLKPGYMAPINLSWGGNNRTTAIRIPSSMPRRLELRVASASSEFISIAIILVTSILYGLKFNNEVIMKNFVERTYGNAQNYDHIPKLYSSIEDAKLYFDLENIILTVLR